jgi:GntR family transcriptional regulator
MPLEIIRDPIYHQLNQALRELLSSGRFGPGQRFLTEREVAERFAVSRATANKALSNLVAEGVLQFRKGVGTFVRGEVLDYDLRRLVSFTERAAAAGKTPSTQVVRFETVPASALDELQRRLLRVGDTEPVYRIERLRLADRRPVILERRVIVAACCPGLARADLKGSLYALWSTRYGLTISGAEQTIGAVALTAADARRLSTRGGAPALQVEAVGFVETDRPLWWERTLYRADRYEFCSRLGALLTARPAVGRFSERRLEDLEQGR